MALVAIGYIGLATCEAATAAPSSKPSTATTETAAGAQSSPARSDQNESQAFLSGTVSYVFDGDTIKVQLESGPIIVRLHSIDTPEHDQPWGPQATKALASRVLGRQVSLRVITQDSYERLVADLFVGNESVNAWMVKQGYAWAYRHYLEDSSYCVWEGEARAARRGLWSQLPDSWLAPWQWREVQRGEPVAYTDYSKETVAHCIAAMPANTPSVVPSVPAEGATTSGGASPGPAQPPHGHCLIKGNISANGKIYHLPGSDSYDRTQIDESKGERWFCSEAEARAAGWRPAAGK
jgi:endonuclease YncB( thermonuclease family)